MAKPKSIWLSSWLERQLVSASVGFLVWVPPVIAVVVGDVISGTPTEPLRAAASGQFHLGIALIIGLSVSVVLLFLQHYFEFQRRTYDPTLAFHFLEDFDSDDFIEFRGTAATLLKDSETFRATLSGETIKALMDIDPVLDFFDSIGFYQHGGQISPEVVHQEFFYWIRGYYQATRAYVEARQDEEAAIWEYLHELYETGQAIEAKRSGATFKKLLTTEKLAEFLQEEIDTWNIVKKKNERP